MPKHAFKFPAEVIDAVRRHVQSAVAAIEPARFSQEANYTAALLTRLDGIAYEGSLGEVSFANTVFDDRGANSAESIFGADHAITATISDGHNTVKKAILVQAKLGRIDSLTPKKLDGLREQIEKMKKVLPAPKVMEIPESSGKRFPAIISGNRILNREVYRPMQLADYFVARILTTLDGCTDPEVVAQVKDSALRQLRVVARIRG